MDTPHIPKSIFGEYFKEVYEPAEDTFLLLDALEIDLHFIKSTATTFLECGSGSGIISIALSKAMRDKPNIIFVTDINEKACDATRKCAIYHDEPNIQVIRTDLAEALVDKLVGKVDLLLFNPPYVPTEASEIDHNRPINLSWAGGKNGAEITSRFLIDYVPKLMSKPNGACYIVALHGNDVIAIKNTFIDRHRIKGDVVLSRKAGIEMLYVIKFVWI